VIRAWFLLVENTIRKYGILLDDIYNFDECGFQMGQISASRVVTSIERQGRPKQVKPTNTEWVTLIVEDATQQMQSFFNEHIWKEKYSELFINWVAKDDITLLQASSPNLRALLLRSGPKVDRLLPQRDTVRAWIMRAFYECKADVTASLQQAISTITFSFDGWTSPNDLALLGIVAHWVDDKRTLRTALIGTVFSTINRLMIDEAGVHA
jgi:hypothetical protein